MKNLFILLVLTFSSFSITGQIEPISIEFDSFRALSELNTPNSGEAYPWISNDGLRIYFTRGSSIDDQLMYSERNSIDENFSEPVPLSINHDLVGNISQWLTEDELDIYFFTREINNLMATTLYHATRNNINDEFNEPIKVEVLGELEGYLLGPSFTNDLNQFFVLNSPPSPEIPALLIFEKSGDNEYTHINEIEFPSGYKVGQGQLSPDGLTFIIGLTSLSSSERDIYLAERDSEEDVFDTFYIIENDQINNSDCTSFLPAISLNSQFMVITKNTTPLWTANDLYIGYNFNPVSTIDYNSQDKNSVKVSPNPASEFINFDLENVDCISSFMSISVYSADGRLIENKLLSKTKANASLSTVHYNSGLYFYKLDCDKEILTGSFIIENR